MHFMLHGVGGFFGGLIGWFLFAYPDHCTGSPFATCTTVLNGSPVKPEAAATVGAIVGIVLWHIGEEAWKDWEERQRRKLENGPKP